MLNLNARNDLQNDHHHVTGTSVSQDLTSGGNASAMMNQTEEKFNIKENEVDHFLNTEARDDEIVIGEIDLNNNNFDPNGAGKAD
jgi:hypothetical protein